MNDKKIIFMGTPAIAEDYLNALIKKNIKIKSVFTQPPKRQSRGMKLIKSPVHLCANRNNIDVLHPEKFDDQIINNLRKIKPDLIIVIAYGRLLPRSVLKLPKFGCINIHVSFLPRWRGPAPIEYALINGDKETGISIIKISEKLDAGPIIIQKKFKIPNHFNKFNLINSLTQLGIDLLVDTIPLILSNKINLKSQNESYATYSYKITSDSRKINFNNTTVEIINHIRAHAPKPGAWFFLNNERIKIIDAKQGVSSGKISSVLNENFEIGCKDGSIEPLIIQREGKKIVTKDEFLRGFNLNNKNIINE